MIGRPRASGFPGQLRFMARWHGAVIETCRSGHRRSTAAGVRYTGCPEQPRQTVRLGNCGSFLTDDAKGGRKAPRTTESAQHAPAWTYPPHHGYGVTASVCPVSPSAFVHPEPVCLSDAVDAAVGSLDTAG
jgi:hypothetical protein